MKMLRCPVCQSEKDERSFVEIIKLERNT